MLVGYRSNEMRDTLRKVAGKHRAYLQEESDRVEGLEIDMGRITMYYRGMDGIMKCESSLLRDDSLFDIGTFRNLRFLKITQYGMCNKKGNYLHKVSDTLESLYLTGVSKNSLEQLKRFPNLKTLTLIDTAFDEESFSLVPKVTKEKLTYLFVNHLARPEDLKDCVNLRCLEADHIENKAETEIVFPNLEHLRTKRIDRLCLSADQFPKLRRLDIGNQQGVVDLQKISQIKSLRELSLQGNSIFDISELEKMSLTVLELSNNMIEDMSPLAGHKDMKYLSISSNPVTDISFIQEMKELELFHLDDTWVEDLSVLKEMKGIKELGISKNLLKTEKDKELVSHIERVLER